MYTKWNEYVAHIWYLETNPGKVSDAAGVTRYTYKDLKFYKSGLPIVPPKVENKNHNETQEIAIDIIRVIFKNHYSIVIQSYSTFM